MDTEQKYEFTGETRDPGNVTLRQIRALRDFGGVKKGELGGWIESEKNLLNDGTAWVSGDAQVYGDARVYGTAQVSGTARVYGDARVSGDAQVLSNKDHIVFKNFWSSGRYFTWTRSNNMWTAGCFHGTGVARVISSLSVSAASNRGEINITNLTVSSSPR